MITEARDYLTGLIRSIMGTETLVYLTEKELAACAESHVAGILISAESLTASGKRVAVQEGRARRKFERSVALSVVLGEYTFAPLEEYYVELLAAIKPVIADAGGFGIRLEPGEVLWSEKSDELLRANVSVILTVNCTGGIYLPVETAPVSDYTVNAQRENG